MAYTSDIPVRHSATLRHDAETHSEALPALVLAAQRAVQNVLSGDHALRKPGIGERFWQFRDYDPSDRPQDIDWRQSAKGDSIYVREKERQSAQNVLFWCSSAQSMDFRSGKALPTKRQAGQTLALATAMLLTRGHETVQLVNGSFLPGRTEKTLQHFAEEILENNAPDISALNAQKIKQNSALVLVSDFLDDIDHTQKALKGISQKVRNGLLVQVLDPAEIDLPYDGRYIFEDMAHGAKETINNVASIRAEYKQRIDYHIQSLKELATRQGWDIVLHRTDEDISRTLFKIWMRFSTDELAYGGPA